MVSTVFNELGSPWTSCSVTVPEVVGFQVMVTGVPAAMPEKSVLVKGFAPLPD